MLKKEHLSSSLGEYAGKLEFKGKVRKSIETWIGNQPPGVFSVLVLPSELYEGVYEPTLVKRLVERNGGDDEGLKYYVFSFKPSSFCPATCYETPCGLIFTVPDHNLSSSEVSFLCIEGVPKLEYWD